MELVKLNGTYLSDDVVDLSQDIETATRFPDGNIPVGQYLGRVQYDDSFCLKDDAETLNDFQSQTAWYQATNYQVTELLAPFCVRIVPQIYEQKRTKEGDFKYENPRIFGE